MENLNEGKKGKSNYMAELAEIDAQSAIVAMEAKIGKLEEMAKAKETRLEMVSEDENLSELISKSAVKEMQKEIKEIRKMQEKLKKVYEKKNGKKPVEVVDEEEKVDEGGYGGMTNYEEDDNKPSMEEDMSELPDEIAAREKYEIERDARRLEETNEEFNRFRKLAGLPIFEQKENLNEMLDYSALERDYMWFRDKNLGNNEAKADKLGDDLTNLMLNGYDKPFNVEKYKEYVKKKLGSNQEKYNSWLATSKIK